MPSACVTPRPGPVTALCMAARAGVPTPTRLSVLLPPPSAACGQSLDHPTRGPVCRLLALDPSAHAAALRPLRRSAADLARDQHAAGALSALPPRDRARRPRARDRRVRRRAARHHPRAEIRRPAIARAPAWTADARARRRHARRRRLRGSGAAPSVAAPRARLQPGGRPRRAARIAGRAWRFAASARPRRRPACRPRSATATCAAPLRSHAGRGGPVDVVVLVDDVSTTGRDARRVRARAGRRRGAPEVRALTAARVVTSPR